MRVEFGVLGPVTAWDGAGRVIELKGPRHRAVLARLLVAGGRTVPVGTLVDDLWTVPPENARGALQTFVSALRRALEPDRGPRARPGLLVTDGGGYAVRAAPDSVDAARFGAAVSAARAAAPPDALRLLDEAAGWWRGPAYADFAEQPWSRAERARLGELRLGAAELRLRLLLDLGRDDAALPDLDAHVVEHPWREEGWRLLALGLYRAGRQKDALDVLRRARSRLAAELGLDPGPALAQLEVGILRHAPRLDRTPGTADQVFSAAVATHRSLGDPRAQLRSTVELLRSLAVTGGPGLVSAREQRLATVRAAEETGDVELTARIIGGYDVPAVWSRSDDPVQAAAIVAAAERALAALPADGRDPQRARLLATIAVETRGGSVRARQAAEQAETIARRSEDPALLAFALNGVFLQSFHRCGLAAERDGVGVELCAVAARHGLQTYEILGRLVRMQARAGLGDLDGADRHAEAAELLAQDYGSPLVGVFTTWYRAMKLASAEPDPDVAAAVYRDAATVLAGAGMPGLEAGLLPLALLSVRLRHRLPVEQPLDWGPYEPWARPHLLLARGRRDEAAAAVSVLPDPPQDHLVEALWCVAARAAVATADSEVMRRARDALALAAAEVAGAGSGLVSFGPVAGYLRELDDALLRSAG